MIDLSVSIVSFNTRELLIDAIRSILKHTTGVSFEIMQPMQELALTAALSLAWKVAQQPSLSEDV